MLYHAARRKIERLSPGRDGWGESRSLLFDGAEVGGQPVEIILAPLLVRVMMAFGALQAGAEEQLAEHGGELGRLPAIPVDHGGAVPVVAPFRHQDLPHELVVGQVAAESVPEPLVEEEDALDPDAVGVGAEQVGPFVGPIIGVGGIVQQPRDQPLPLLGGGGRVGQEGPHLFGRRQPSDRIQLGPAQKLRVRAQLRGEKPQALEVGVGERVDEVVAGQAGELACVQ